MTSALIVPVIPPRSAPALSWTKASSSIASLRRVCWNLAVWLIRPPLAVQATIPSSCRGRALHPPDGGRGFWWDLLGLSGHCVWCWLAFGCPCRPGRGPAARHAGPNLPARFWFYAAFAVVYGICERMNGNWSRLEMITRVGASAT